MGIPLKPPFYSVPQALHRAKPPESHRYCSAYVTSPDADGRHISGVTHPKDGRPVITLSPLLHVLPPDEDDDAALVQSSPYYSRLSNTSKDSGA
jgi:hypothetical protein